MNPIWSQIISSLNDIKAGKAKEISLKAYTSAPDTRNEAIFFIKPELAAEQGVKLEPITALLDDLFTKFNVEIMAASVLGGAYLDEKDIMARHYGTINKISREGKAALSPGALAKLESKFATELAEGAEVMGGHQFLKVFPFFNAASLSVLWDCKNHIVEKLAPGTYAMSYLILDKKVVLLNGFHPYQLEYYTHSSKAIAVAVVRSTTSWADLRNHLIGATDPTKAEEGSARRKFLENKAEWGIAQINRGINGVHLSAGPLEGYFELQRFFGNMVNVAEHSNFLKAAGEQGYTESNLQPLEANPIISKEEGAKPVFDATEEIDIPEALAYLKKANF